MDWAAIGPSFLGIAGLVTAVAALLNRRDNKATAQHAQDLAERVQTSKELEQAWELYKEVNVQQTKRMDQLQKQNEDLLARQTQQQKVVDSLQEEVRACETRNSRLEADNLDLNRRVDELEERLRDNGLSTS
jgi:predicted nuclease with TOPRIM domain